MLIANFPFQKTVWAAQKTSASLCQFAASALGLVHSHEGDMRGGGCQQYKAQAEASETH